MGDLIDINIPRKLTNYYEFTSNSMNFEVKAPRYALIGLKSDPSSNQFDYLVCIGYHNHCWIIENDEEHPGDSTEVPFENLGTDLQDYQRFWLSWHSGLISLGRYGDPKPILTHPLKDPNLKYVAFGPFHQFNSEWRFRLSPIRPLKSQPECKDISDGKLRWVEAQDQLPDGAFIGGFEKEILYIVRASHQNSLTPGKFVPSEGTAYIPWGGQANEKDTFEVLCGYDCKWEQTCDDSIPVGAFVAGYSEDRHETLYVGRAEHKGHLIPGKVQPSHKVCYIPFEGREVAVRKYEILVEPTYAIRSVNKNYAVYDVHSMHQLGFRRV